MIPKLLRWLVRLIHRPRPRPPTILWKRDGGWGEERPLKPAKPRPKHDQRLQMAEYPIPVTFKLCDFIWHPALGMLSYWHSNIAETSCWIKVSVQPTPPFHFVQSQDMAMKVALMLTLHYELHPELIPGILN